MITQECCIDFGVNVGLSQGSFTFSILGLALGSSVGFVSQTSIPSAKNQNGFVGGGGGGTGSEEQSPYERLLWQNEHDENARREMAFGKRIGFYRFKSELGTGNFSKVKLATNLLTKGGWV